MKKRAIVLEKLVSPGLPGLQVATRRQAAAKSEINCVCFNKFYSKFCRFSTIQVHDSCQNSTIHFLQGTVNLSSVRKLSIWGCLCFLVTCIFVIKKLAVRVVLKYCRLDINAVKLVSHLVWFSECTEAKYRNLLYLSVFVIRSIVESKKTFCVRRRRTHPNLAVGSGWMPDFRPGDRLAASTSCATVSDMVTKLCFALVSMSRTLQFLHRIQFLSARRTAYNRQPNQSTDRDSTIMH